MKSKFTLIARLLLGLIMAVFGLNGLLMFSLGKGFIPTPPPPPEMMEIMNGFMKTGYLLILVKALETIAGVLLLVGIYKRLALTMLAPIVVNILGIHLFAEQSGLPMAIILTFLTVFLISTEWQDGFDHLLQK